MGRLMGKSASKGLRILVTNDDGIHAPGLKVLEKIAHKLTRDVWTVAPEEEQSGSAHSLSLANPCASASLPRGNMRSRERRPTAC